MDIEKVKSDYLLYKPYYEILQKEVYIFLDELKNNIKSVDIESVKQRPHDKIKDLNSIIDNIREKKEEKYARMNNLIEIDDIAGNRITCHCQSDREILYNILDGELRQRFIDIRGDRKNEGKNEVYRAYHFNFAKLFEINGERIKLFAEIQIRTVLGNAWAVQDTKYIYKNKMSQQGELKTLSKAVSDILYGCEGLWDLVKTKCYDNLGIEVKKIENLQKVYKDKIQDRKINFNNDPKQWFGEQEKISLLKLRQAGIHSFMELNVNLPGTNFNFPKAKLKECAHDSTIHTFGWPIAVFIESREEYRPKPVADGILAEVSTKQDILKEDASRNTYDYWLLKHDGSFYLLTSLFEDLRKPTHLFFDTRTIRITEALMYISNLYSRLGVDQDQPILITIKHGGIKGRLMGSAGNRIISWERKSIEDEVVTTVQTSLKEINENLIVVVRKFTDPLFEMFDFFSVGPNIIEDIITKFTNGIIN